MSKWKEFDRKDFMAYKGAYSTSFINDVKETGCYRLSGQLVLSEGNSVVCTGAPFLVFDSGAEVGHPAPLQIIGDMNANLYVRFLAQNISRTEWCPWMKVQSVKV